MRIPTAIATASILGTWVFASCDFSPVAPQESERFVAPSSGATALGSLSALRGNGLVVAAVCARSPGFWCQNNDGHPEMSEAEFDAYAAGAIALLMAEGVTSLQDADDVRAAVCDTKRQLLRHLTSVALNLAAGFVSASDPLTGQDAALGTVGDAFAEGARVFLLGDASPKEERNGIKDVLDRINNNENIDNACTSDPGEGEEGEEGEQGGEEGGEVGVGGAPPTALACPIDSDGKITICHAPPGNPANRKTIRVSPDAWPAHEAHGDSCGACS